MAGSAGGGQVRKACVAVVRAGRAVGQVVGSGSHKIVPRQADSARPGIGGRAAQTGLITKSQSLDAVDANKVLTGGIFKRQTVASRGAAGAVGGAGHTGST